MIQKIKSNEYLKRMEAMSLSERNDYLTRVVEWAKKQAPILRKKMDYDTASYQNIVQMSSSLNDVECRAFEEGAILLSAIPSSAAGLLPDSLYNISAKRAIKKMVKALGDCILNANINSSRIANSPEQTKQSVVNKPANKVSNGHIVDGDKNHQEKVAQGMQPLSSGASAVPVRPKHIDQYVHLLPKKTQDRAALVKGLLRDMDTARENARRLAMAYEHPDKIATWAKTVTALDNKLKSIYNELDSEWEKLVKEGKVGVDDFGNAYITEKGQQNIKTDDGKKRGRKPMTEDEKKAAQEKRAARQAEKQAEKDAKLMEALKKNLRDTRTKNTPARQAQWKRNLKQLLMLGGEITDSIRKAAEYYNIKIEEL